MIFDFVGKSHKEHHIELRDPKLAHAIEQCDDLPGHRLFQYLDDDGTKHPVDSGDVNDYLRNITGQEFTAKDFRTWAGTVIAAIALRAMPEAFDPKAREKQIVDAVKATAAELGNTPATCRKYYIHPLIFETHLDGSLTPRCRPPSKPSAMTPSRTTWRWKRWPCSRCSKVTRRNPIAAGLPAGRASKPAAPGKPGAIWIAC